MSRISDPDVDLLTTRARAARMPEPELARWLVQLSPVGLDICGCRFSALATCVALPVAIVAAASGVLGVGGAAGLTLGTAVAAKLAGRWFAQRRRTARLAAWWRRVHHLGAP